MCSVLASELTWYLWRFDSPINSVRTVALWLTVLLAVAFVISFLLIKSEGRGKLIKIFIATAICYATALGVTFLSLSLKEDGVVKELFVPLLILIFSVGGSAVTLCVTRKNKVLNCVLGGICGCALVAVLVCMGVFYAKNYAEDGYYNSSTASVNQLVLYLGSAVLIAVIVGLGFIFGKGDRKEVDSKSIAYAAVCIAMSYALSYLRVFKMPQGGSVTVASLLPLMLYSYMFGTRKGVFAGLIYGVLQALQDGWIIHPAQFLLDYPIAFCAIGLAGAFARVKKLSSLPWLSFSLGALLASAFRFICHVLSGVFAFSAYAGEQNVWVYSLAYNSFVFVDIAIVLAVGILVLCSKSFVKLVRAKQTSETAAN